MLGVHSVLYGKALELCYDHRWSSECRCHVLRDIVASPSSARRYAASAEKTAKSEVAASASDSPVVVLELVGPKASSLIQKSFNRYTLFRRACHIWTFQRHCRVFATPQILLELRALLTSEVRSLLFTYYQVQFPARRRLVLVHHYQFSKSPATYRGSSSYLLGRPQSEKSLKRNLKGIGRDRPA